uniref:AF4/FMR2 C-terminal homology domain-containing protein n=1 Tax=Strix occidentalis caurina TaxID=311401 RepID=A0A8D0L0J6_STROC
WPSSHVKTKGKPKSSDRKDSKPALQEPTENRKHKSSHQANTKPFLDPKLMRDVLPVSAQEHLALSPLPQGQGTTPTRTSGHRPAVVAREDFHQDKLPLSVREKKLLSPMRDSPTPQSLMVKIDLPLLSRVPQPPGKGSHQKRAETKELPGARKQDLERKTTDTPDKASKASVETQKKYVLLPAPLPPMSPARPAPKSTKTAKKRPRSESDELPAMDNTARNKSSHKDPLLSKHKKEERNHAEPSKGVKTDKTGKAFQYLDAALSFLEYGIALESDASAPKSAYSIFSDTIDLLNRQQPASALMLGCVSVHSMRCQSLLHMAMFRYKKDTALKYSRILNEHFKVAVGLTDVGMPSPRSPMPSPAGSVSSQPGSNASNCSGNSIVSAVTIPCNIPNVTSSYVNITSYILYAYDIWEKADALARKNTEFFAELSTATCALALNSSMTEVVHYARQGLHTEQRYVTIKTAKWSALPAFQPHPLAFVSQLLS